MTQGRTPRWLVNGCLPGRRFTCSKCGEKFVFARTVATERGRGGKAMPLNLKPDPAGNVGARMHGRSLVCEVLTKNGYFDPDWARAMPHAATCDTTKLHAELHADVEAYLRQHAGGTTP